MLVSIRLLRPGRLLFGDLRCQSLVLVSTHLLQPCRPLLGSLRCQSIPQALQPGLPLLSSLGYQSLVLVSTHLLQPVRPLLGSLRCQSVCQPLQSGLPLLITSLYIGHIAAMSLRASLTSLCHWVTFLQSRARWRSKNVPHPSHSIGIYSKERTAVLHCQGIGILWWTRQTCGGRLAVLSSQFEAFPPTAPLTNSQLLVLLFASRGSRAASSLL